MRGWKRSRISELKSAAGTATNLAVLVRRIGEGSLPRSNLMNSDELIAPAPVVELVLALASRLQGEQWLEGKDNRGTTRSSLPSGWTVRTPPLRGRNGECFLAAWRSLSGHGGSSADYARN